MAQGKGIRTREEDYSGWYLDVIAHGDLLDEAPVRGCKVLKPHGFAIWERIQQVLDARFKGNGARQCLFPLVHPDVLSLKRSPTCGGLCEKVRSGDTPSLARRCGRTGKGDRRARSCERSRRASGRAPHL